MEKKSTFSNIELQIIDVGRKRKQNKNIIITRDLNGLLHLVRSRSEAASDSLMGMKMYNKFQSSFAATKKILIL